MRDEDAIFALVVRQPVRWRGQTARPEQLAGDDLWVTLPTGGRDCWPLAEVQTAPRGHEA